MKSNTVGYIVNFGLYSVRDIIFVDLILDKKNYQFSSLKQKEISMLYWYHYAKKENPQHHQSAWVVCTLVKVLSIFTSSNVKNYL